MDFGLTFEWDDAKSEANLAKHGVPFDVATEAFFADDLIVLEDDRRDYGENRFIAFGTVEGFPLAVAYTVRDGIVRIISARRQSRKERKT